MRRVDLIRGTIEVAVSLADVRGKLVFGPTKRTPAVTFRWPGSSVTREEFLRGRRSDLDALVFTNMAGGPLRHNWFSKASFKPAVLAGGLPTSLRFHDLRDTYAAFCNSTADPKAVMRRMGHSPITVTCGTYGHRSPPGRGHHRGPRKIASHGQTAERLSAECLCESRNVGSGIDGQGQ